MADSNIQSIYPLTPMQEGILYHTLESPEAGAYFNQFTCRFEGPLDIDQFERALRDAFKRHSALRTLFTWEKRDRPLQIVRRRVELPFSTLDWRDRKPEVAAGDIEAFLERDRAEGFELGVAPLCRLTLIRLDDELSQFVFSFHHILLDGWSVRLVLDEVMCDYRGSAAEPVADAPTASFESFVSWRSEQDYAPGKAFWQENLAGFAAPTTPDIRLERDGYGKADGRPGQQANLALSREASARLRALAKERRVTLNTVLVAAWSILLARYCDTRDVVFGTTVAGRSGELEGIDRIAGLLINTLPLRVKLGEAMTVDELLRETQAQQVRQQTFEQMSLQDIRNCSEVPAQTPLFETILVFENLPEGQDRQADAPKITERRFIEHSNFPLALLIVPSTEIELIAIYDERRFSDEAIRKLLRALDYVLEQITGSRQRPVHELTAVPPDETDRLLELGRGPQRAPDDGDRSVVELFERRVRETPDAIAVSSGSNAETYDELNRKANRLARHLLDRHAVRGRAVVIHARRSNAAIVAMLASLKSGAVYVPTDVNEPGSRLRQVVADLAAHFESPAGSRPLILTEAEFAADVPDDIADVERIEAVDASGDDGDLGVALESGEPAYVIYTSGSTGEPKGVMVPHGALRNSNLARFEFYDDPPEAFALVSSLATDSSLAGIYWTLCSGGKLVITPPRTELDIEALSALIREESISHILCVPSLYALVLENADLARLASLRAVIVAGEATNAPLVERHAALMPDTRLYNEYGPSEACVWVTAAELRAGNVPIGRPILNSTAHVLDTAGRLAPAGVTGELYVGGANLALGYLGRPEATARSFDNAPFAPDGPRLYRTGDRVRAAADGELEYLGRVDRQLKIRGFRIEPGEIEAVLAGHPDVDEAVVYKQSFPSGDQLVAAVAGPRASDADLRSFCDQTLPGHMVPQHYAVMDKLPRTRAGKADRDAIEREARFDESSGDGVAPRTEVEKTLAAIWQDVMGFDEIYVHDNFFEIGGDSLMTIRILSRAAREGLKISPEQFFEKPTIAGQAALVGAREDDAGETRAEAGPMPLLPIQHWFFESVLSDPQQWNQSFLFEVDTAVETAAMERAFAELVGRHDAFRTRFSQSGSTWSADVVDSIEVAVECVSICDGAEIDDVANQLNASFDLGEAPLFRACHVKSSTSGPNYLLLVIHHLVVDVESWRLLTAELDALLRQEESSRAAPENVGGSASRWAKSLLALADSPQLAADRNYWAELLPGDPCRAPVDGDGANGAIRERDCVTRSFRVDRDRNEGIRATTREALRASTHELIVSAVARAMAGWAGTDRVVIDTEGHGREPLDGVDATATIGWLTSLFPLVFDGDDATWGDASAALRLVKERLRSIPNKGVTFGLLRYLADADDDATAAIRSYASADVLFNYLGDVSAERDEGALLSLVDRTFDSSRNPACERAFPVEINAYEAHGELIFDVTYSEKTFAHATIDALGERLLEGIHDIADAAENKDANATVAADFPLADLSTEDLDSIAAQIDALEK